MASSRYKANQAVLNGLLHNAGGPVYRHVQLYMRESTRLAKLAAPKNTGTLAASTRGVGPVATAEGVQARVTASAINPRTGEDYSLAVHQGHGDINPINYPYLKFYWSKKRSFVRTLHVRPRAGRPFLYEGLQGANSALPAHQRFKLIVKRQWRTDGS